MPPKAPVAFGIALAFGLLTFAVPARCSDTDTPEHAIGHPVETVPRITQDQTVLSMLTLDEALTRALKENPRLSASSQEVKAREVEARQAGLRSNPELSFGVENIAGSGDFSGTGRAETTIRISQLVELGGKRARRQEAGRLEEALAEKELEIVRAEVIAETTDRFVEVLAAQERLSLAEEQAGLAVKVSRAVEERIAAGKSATIERVRLHPLTVEARLRQETARQALGAARQALASALGSEEVDFETLQGTFEEIGTVPDWSDLASRIPRTPTSDLQEMASRRADHTLSLERANRIPDLTLSLGAKNDRESGDNALVAEIAFPLPVFDRNRDAIVAARARKTKAQEEARSSRLLLRAELAECRQRWHSAYSEATALRDEILPGARNAFDAVTYGYQAGKFDFLEVLDAERTLFDAKSRYIDALTACHLAVSQLERLLGRKITAGGALLASTEKKRGQS